MQDKKRQEKVTDPSQLRTDVWFTSDNHFGHKGILQHCPTTREGKDVGEMDELMIQRWNANIKPGDTVYCLGDFTFYKDPAKIHAILERLNGAIHLITGNHCWFVKGSKQYDKYFADVKPYKEIMLDGHKLCLFHYPMVEWNNMHHGSFHLFGHVHGGLPDQPFRSMDVGIDTRANGMIPYTWKEVYTTLVERPIKPHHGKVTE